MFRDAVHTFTVAVSGTLLGTSIPLLSAVIYLGHYNGMSQNAEMIALLSLVIAFASLAVVYSLRAILLPAVSPQTALQVKTNASLLAVLISLGAGCMGWLTAATGAFRGINHPNPRGLILTGAMYERVEAIVNGTSHGPRPGPLPRHDSKRGELSALLYPWMWSVIGDQPFRHDIRGFGMATIILGWVLVALLIVELGMALLPAQRRFWFERTNGGISLRWKDRGFALSDDNEVPELPGAA